MAHDTERIKKEEELAVRKGKMDAHHEERSQVFANMLALHKEEKAAGKDAHSKARQMVREADRALKKMRWDMKMAKSKLERDQQHLLAQRAQWNEEKEDLENTIIELQDEEKELDTQLEDMRELQDMEATHHTQIQTQINQLLAENEVLERERDELLGFLKTAEHLGVGVLLALVVGAAPSCRRRAPLPYPRPRARATCPLQRDNRCAGCVGSLYTVQVFKRSHR